MEHGYSVVIAEHQSLCKTVQERLLTLDPEDVIERERHFGDYAILMPHSLFRLNPTFRALILVMRESDPCNVVAAENEQLGTLIPTGDDKHLISGPVTFDDIKGDIVRTTHSTHATTTIKDAVRFVLRTKSMSHLDSLGHGGVS